MKQEQLRVEAVNKFLKLNLSKEKELQNIVELAAEICQVPTALITLLDRDTQHVRFRVGLNVDKTGREVSFCTYAINHNKVFEVEDSYRDSRFANNPLVTGDPHIRSYTGAPLTTTDGHKLGTLCVISNEPKILSERQKYLLQILSKQVITILEMELGLNLLSERLKTLEAENAELRRELEGEK